MRQFIKGPRAYHITSEEMFFITLVVVLLTLIVVWLKWNYGYWKRHGVPGPSPAMIFGNIGSTLTFSKTLTQLGEEWYNGYSTPYVGYYKFLTPAILLRDVNLVRDVLIKDFNYFGKNGVTINEKNDPLLAQNPFVRTGDDWKKSRSMLSQLFSLSRIKTMFPLMKFACDDLINYLKEQNPTSDVEAKSLSVNFTTQNIVRCTYSMDAKCFSDTESEFRVMGKKILQPSLWGGIKIISSIICPLLYKFFPISFLEADIDRWIRKLTKENAESRKNAPIPNEDILQLLLNLKVKHDLTDTEIAGLALSTFIAGYETSSSLMAFTLYELAKYPHLQENCYHEIKGILEKHGNNLSFESVTEATYLDCFIDEVLRVDSIGLSLKVCTEPYELPVLDGQDKPFTTYPGMPVLISTKSLHFDPELFPNPEIFDPERFNEESKKSIIKGSYLPFLEGPRMCPGMRFALLQVKIGVASVLINFEVKLSPNCKPFVLDTRTIIYQARDGLLLNFVKRHNATGS